MLCTFFFIFVIVSLCNSIAREMTYAEKTGWNNGFLSLDLVPLFKSGETSTSTYELDMRKWDSTNVFREKAEG